MTPGHVITRLGLGRDVCASAVLLTLASAISTHAAPALRSADIRVAMGSADACDVTMLLTLDGGGPVDHRIAAVDDTQIVVSALRGARQVQGPRTVGRTQSLVLDSAMSEYELTYSVRRVAMQNRCPLWVPAAPADGVSRAVRISVAVPPGMSAHSTMPAFTWTGSTGTTTLGHIPAFVLVPFAPAGESATWDVSTAMDVLTILVFVGATSIWIWRRRG
jgi:hypothetical protein